MLISYIMHSGAHGVHMLTGTSRTHAVRDRDISHMPFVTTPHIMRLGAPLWDILIAFGVIFRQN